jgi:hypothetical protein
MSYIKERAAEGIHIDCPPRLASSRCGDYHMSVVVSNQPSSRAQQEKQTKAGEKMSQELIAKREQEFALIEKVVLQGDLSALSPEQRVLHYRKVCESSGLNPYSNPFEYIKLNGKLTLYAKKDCTEQLRTIHGVSIEALDTKLIDDLYIVTARAKNKHGRIDQSTGAVVIGNLKGDAKANAIMKAETKAKRRVTLSICGMGWTDASEIDSIPNAKTVDVDLETGEIKDETAPKAAAPAIENKPKINDIQICELQMILDDCDPKYKEWVYARVKKGFNTDDLSGLPFDMFEATKAAALKNMNDTHAKQRVEAQPELVTAEAVQ